MRSKLVTLFVFLLASFASVSSSTQDEQQRRYLKHKSKKRYNDNNCRDYVEFQDGHGRDCQFFDSNPVRCTFLFRNPEGDASSNACCACGGGINLTNDGGSCYDFLNFEDGHGRNCEFFQDHPNRCTFLFENLDGHASLNACCACGGGNPLNNEPPFPPTSSGQFEGLFYIQSVLTGDYLNFNAKEGVKMENEDEDGRFLIEIIPYNNNYAFKQFCAPDGGCEQDLYLTITDPTGIAIVDTSFVLTEQEEFEVVPIVSINFSGSVVFRQVVGPRRYLSASGNVNGDVSTARTISFAEQFQLHDLIV